MIDENLKKRLDQRLIDGEINTDDYNRILQMISKGYGEQSTPGMHYKKESGSNKKVIWISIAILIIYAVFAAYQDIKARQEAEEIQRVLRNVDQALQGQDFLKP